MAEPLDRLVECLSRLPGVGRRSARRMAMKLVQDRTGLVRDLIDALKDAGKDIQCCSLCGSITRRDRDPCRLCTNPGRDSSVLCVVEDPGDIDLIERSGSFRGRYHALMGKISPMKGEGADDIRMKSLLNRLQSENIREVILALSTDMEGDSTAGYIVEQLGARKVKVSRLALGLPAGSGVGYSDSVTLARALKGRVEL
mgnify:CR=1 FL=1